MNPSDEFDLIAGGISRIFERELIITEIAEIQVDIINIPNKCGNCDHWMKSSKCPREVRDISGRLKAVNSCNGLSCHLFIESAFSCNHKETLKNRIKELTKRLRGE